MSHHPRATSGRALFLRAPPSTRASNLLVTARLFPLLVVVAAIFLPVLSEAAFWVAPLQLNVRDRHHHHHHHYKHRHRSMMLVAPQQQLQQLQRGGRLAPSSSSFLLCSAPQSPFRRLQEDSTDQGDDDDDRDPRFRDPRFRDLAAALRRMQILQAPPPPSSSSEQEVSRDERNNDFDLNAIIPPKNLVQVRPSSIASAGMGVFARQNIRAGTLVGFYPAHALGVDFDFGNDDDDNDENNNTGSSTTVRLAARREDQSYFDDRAAAVTTTTTTNEPNYVHYLMGSRKIGAADFGSGSKLFVDVRPGRALGDRWISHYVNDGATVRTRSERSMLDYYARSRRFKNCVHIPFAAAPLIATVTTRKVKKNQELFTTYGCLYWTEQIPTGSDADDGNDASASSTEAVTEDVLMEAKATAQDIFVAMQSARAKYARQQQELEQMFAKL